MPDLEPIKRAPASTGIIDALAIRWSPRAISNRPVSTEDHTKIFTYARFFRPDRSILVTGVVFMV